MEAEKMQYDSGNTVMGFISGIIGGIGSYVLDIKIHFLTDMAVAIITALLCGAAGVAGKEAYQIIKKRIVRRWNSKKD